MSSQSTVNGGEQIKIESAVDGLPDKGECQWEEFQNDILSLHQKCMYSKSDLRYSFHEQTAGFFLPNDLTLYCEREMVWNS